MTSVPSDASPKQIAYVPVRVSTLRGEQKISFDLYLQVGGKHILYIRRGDSFEGTRLERLKERKLRKMFIVPDDEPQYRKYIQSNTELAYDPKSGASIENRVSVIQGLQQSSAETVMEDPASAESYAIAKEGSQKFADFLLSEEKAVKSLLAIENGDQNLAAHGVSVAAMAVAIAKRIGQTDPKNVSMLTLGSMLHDLSHYQTGIPYQLPLSQMTGEQLTRYKQHPLDGARMVKDLNHFDQHVTQIILEHEELIDGSGFPHGLSEKKCNPLSVIVATANAYDRMVTFEHCKPQDTVKRLVVERIGRYPLDQLNALKAIVSES